MGPTHHVHRFITPRRFCVLTAVCVCVCAKCVKKSSTHVNTDHIPCSSANLYSVLCGRWSCRSRTPVCVCVFVLPRDTLPVPRGSAWELRFRKEARVLRSGCRGRITDRVTRTAEVCSLQFRGLEAQGKGAGRLGSQRGLSAWRADGHLWRCPRAGRTPCGVSSHRGPAPPQGPCLHAVSLGVGILTCGSGGGTVQFTASALGPQVHVCLTAKYSHSIPAAPLPDSRVTSKA